MSGNSTTEQYTALIPPANADKPNFQAAVTALVAPYVAGQNFLATIPGAYDISVAIGVQLDVVGQWVGRSRNLDEPLPPVYFSFDDPYLGFDQGIWYNQFSPVEAITSLDDDTYRQLLQAWILANGFRGTVAEAQTILTALFPTGTGTYAAVQDGYDMSMAYYISGTWPNVAFLALFLSGTIPIRPEGVYAAWLVTSVSGSACFGFDLENEYIQGFDQGAWAVDYLPTSYMPSLDFSDPNNSMYLPYP